MLFLVVFIGNFCRYLSTLTGTISAYRDSGDLVNATYTLGIAHPPGYPLYILMGHIFTKALPFASPAYRVNVFSALCAAISAALVYAVSARSLNNPVVERYKATIAALIAATVYAATPAVDVLARVAEMYALAAVFGIGIIACWRVGTEQALALACFLLGLGFGVHPTLLALSPLLVVWKPREAAVRLGFFALGFSVVIALWVRAHTNPVQNWGNPSTFENLWNLITRSNYGGLKLHPTESQFAWTPESVLAQVVSFSKTLWHEWGWLGLIVGFVGIARSFKADRRLLVSWALAGVGFVVLSNLPLGENTTEPILQPYFVLVNVIWTLWVARGIWEVFSLAPSPAAVIILSVVFVAVPFWELQGSFESYRNDFYVYDLGRNMARSLPVSGVLYDPDDPVAFTLRTLQLTERRREDLMLLSFFRTRWGYEQIRKRWPDLLPSAPIQNGQELDRIFWTYSAERHPFFVDLPAKIAPPKTYLAEGVVYRVEPKGRNQSPEELARAEALSLFYVWRGDWITTHHRDFFTQHIVNYRAAARCNMGLKYAERSEWDNARRCYWEALILDPQLSAAYNDLGVVDFNQGRYASAAQNYQRALQYDPSNPGYQRNLDLARQRLPI